MLFFHVQFCPILALSFGSKVVMDPRTLDVIFLLRISKWSQFKFDAIKNADDKHTHGIFGITFTLSCPLFPLPRPAIPSLCKQQLLMMTLKLSLRSLVNIEAEHLPSHQHAMYTNSQHINLKNISFCQSVIFRQYRVN